MKSAKDIMSKAIVSVSPEASLHDAMDLILECGVSGLPVIDQTGELVGIISEADLCLLTTQHRQAECSVAECMTRVVSTVDEDAPIEDIAELLMRKNIRRVPVKSNGRVVGIVSRRDIVRAMNARSDVEETVAGTPS